MKILFHHRIASADGQFVHMTELVKALREKGHDVRIVGSQVNEKFKLGETVGIFHAMKRNIPKPIYEVMEASYSWIAYRRLSKAADDFKPDAIYERYNLHLHAGRFVARRLKVPYLLEVNAPLTDERAKYGGLALVKFARWSDRVIWKSADYVLPVSEVLATYVKRGGVSADKIRVIHNGVDLKAYEGVGSRDDAKAKLGLSGKVVLGFVGFLREWHGLSNIMEFMASPAGQNLHLMIVGDGWAERERLNALMIKLQLSDRVTIAGFVPRNEIPGYLAAFDIALQPAVTDYASPLKLFEYMASGCAILAPDAANIKEIVRHDKEAILFDPGNRDALVAAVNQLLNDRALTLRLGAAARERILSVPFTWHENAVRVEQLIRQVASEISKAQV